MNTAALEAKGVVICYDAYYEPENKWVTQVFFNLTPTEWCNLAMRDGDSYIGGCCGTSGYIQDEINSIFRDSGNADADALYTIGDLAQHHPDGFEEWGFIDPMTQEAFDEKCERWESLEPWEKIGLIYQGVRDRLRPHRHTIEPIVQKDRPDLDEKRDYQQLLGGLRYLDFPRFGKNNDQTHSTDIWVMAKLLPGARRLVKKLEADTTSWSGVAIVEKERPDVIVSNGLGACLYATKEDAEKVRALWTDKDLANATSIRSLTISVSDGILFQDA